MMHMLRAMARPLAALAALLLVAPGAAQEVPPPPPVATAPAAAIASVPVILISVDGMRADYLTRGLTPNISALAASGVTTTAMRPSFPSLTFPNHYTIVTGLRPDHHGVVNNNMEDAALGRFAMSIRDAVSDGRWWADGEPIWVTAERAGIPTATMFWPGSEAEVGGVRPRRWLPFDGKMPEAARVDRVLAWLDESPRPGLATLYFDTVDHDGHSFGPDSPEVNRALAEVDRQIGRLVDGLKARGITANIIIAADHGMAAVSPERLIILEQLLDPASIRLVASGAVAAINPAAGQEAAVRARLLAPHPHMQCWDKANIPARLHYGSHPRVPAIICAAEPGWSILMTPLRPEQLAMPLAGMHGYDPDAPAMAASFVASGPAFKAGLVLPSFDNVDIHPLLLRLLGLPPMRTDGDPAALAPALK